MQLSDLSKWADIRPDEWPLFIGDQLGDDRFRMMYRSSKNRNITKEA